MRRRLKVMHMIWSMGDGGAQRVVLDYLAGFRNDPDIELFLCVYSRKTDSYCDRQIKENGYPVYYLNQRKSFLEFPGVRRFFGQSRAEKIWKKALLKFQPDIVHVHISALLGTVLEPIVECGVPVRFDTLHSAPERYAGEALEINRRAFTKEHFVGLCLTEEQRERARSRYGMDAAYEILRNGIDFRSIEQRMVSREKARREMGIDRDTFVVLGVGRLNRVKNFGLLIRAFSHVSEKRPDTLLLLAGDGGERKHLEELAERLCLTDKVKFLGNLENIVPLYCCADVLGITSESESCSLVLLEAQACGLRSVISEGTPLESIFSDRVKKMDTEEEEKWAMALLDAGYAGRKVTDREEYDIRHVCRRLKELYLKYWRSYSHGRKEIFHND